MLSLEKVKSELKNIIMLMKIIFCVDIQNQK